MRSTDEINHFNRGSIGIKMS